jgi:hypothetical protein
MTGRAFLEARTTSLLRSGGGGITLCGWALPMPADLADLAGFGLVLGFGVSSDATPVQEG